MKTVHGVLIEAGLWFGQSIGQGDFLLENDAQLPRGKWLLVFLAVRNQKITGYRITNTYHDGPHEGCVANKKQENGAGEHLHQAATATVRDVFPGNCLRRFHSTRTADLMSRELQGAAEAASLMVKSEIRSFLMASAGGLRQVTQWAVAACVSACWLHAESASGALTPRRS